MNLLEHDCEPSQSWWARDGRGIELCRVCLECVDIKLAVYRPEILASYTQADVNEPIEPEDC